MDEYGEVLGVRYRFSLFRPFFSSSLSDSLDRYFCSLQQKQADMCSLCGCVCVCACVSMCGCERLTRQLMGFGDKQRHRFAHLGKTSQTVRIIYCPQLDTATPAGSGGVRFPVRFTPSFVYENIVRFCCSVLVVV